MGGMMTFCSKWDFEFESIYQPEAGTTTSSTMHATVMWLGTFEYVVMRRDYLGRTGRGVCDGV